MNLLANLLPTTTPAPIGPRDPWAPAAPLSDRERQRVRRDAAASIVAARNTHADNAARLAPQLIAAKDAAVASRAAHDATMAELTRVETAIAQSETTQNCDIAKAERQMIETADERIDAAARRFWRWYHAARQSSPPAFDFEEIPQPDGSILRRPRDWAALLTECVNSIRAAATTAEALRFETLSTDEITARLESIEDQIVWTDGGRRAVSEKGFR